MNTIMVKTNNATQTVAEVAVVTKDGKPTIIQAMEKVNYEFHDMVIGRAPNHIITKRIKNDLHVSFEENGKDSDLIIEGFYDSADSALVGIAEDGDYYYYIPDTGETYDYVTQLEVGDVEGQALGGEEYVAAAIPWWVPVTAGLGLAGLIAGISGSGSDDRPEPAPIVSLSGVKSLSEATATNDANTAIYSVTLDKASDVDTSVTVTITPGSANGGDYTAPTTQTITIPAGQTSVNFSIPIVNDNVYEGAQSFMVAITSVSAGKATIDPVKNVVTTTVYDDGTIDGTTPVDPNDPTVGDDTPIVSIKGTVNLSETAADGSVNSATYTVSLSNPSAVDTTISYIISDGSTEGSDDYVAPTIKTVTIPAGQTSVDFTLPMVDDSIYEGAEDFTVTITGTTAGTANISADNDSVTTTIYDNGTTDGTTPVNPADPTVGNDIPVVSIAATDAQAIEGVDNTLIFSVTQTNLSNLDTTVNVSLGAANTVEAADIASISYTNATGVVVSLTTATQIQDFLANGASVTIPAGETAAPVITVTIADDVVYEQSEDLVLEIGSPVNATIGTNSATGVILDESNDPANPGSNTEGDKPVVSVSNATTDEGGDLVHTVTLSNPTEVPVSYPFAITDGSATAGDDYSNAPVFSDGVVLNTDGSITIPAGVTNFTVSYPALNDDLDELNETTTLTIGTGVGTGTITDTDVAPIISISATDATGIEGVTDDTIVFSIDQAGLSDRATSVIATLNLTDAEAADIDSILLTNADGSTQTISVADAIAGVTVSIPAGTLLADMPSFSITPTQDAIYEISETIGMSLSSPVNAALGTATASAEILDEDGGAIDAPVVSIAATDAQAIEGVDNTLIFSVTQTNLSNLDTTVNVSLGAANTVEAADIASISYTNATGVVVTLDNLTDIQAFLTNGATVTIPAGSTSAPAITVTVIDDVVYERSEDLVLNIAIPTSSPTAATVGTGSTTGVILDEDQRVNTNNPNNPDDVTDEVDGDKPVVSVSDATTDEGGDLVHTVTLSNPTEVPVSYPFAITDGSATTATGDYSNAPVFSDGVVLNADGSITIPAGVTNFTVSYPALNDDLDELNETTTLTIGTGVGTGTITDTDVAPIISISATDATGIEGVTDDTIVFSIDQAGLSDRATSVIATLNLTDAEAADIDSILLTNADGSTQTISVADAIAGVTVSIPAGTLLADMPSFSITPTQDAIYEISETIGMSLSSPVNAALGTATASAEILDEDGGAIDAPVVSIAATDAQAIEGVDNTLIFSVTQTNLSNLDTTVNVSLGAANTVEAADIASISYTNATGVVVTLDNLTDIQAFLTNGATVTIPAGSTSAPAITVTVIDDVVYERSEDLVLNIAIPTSSPTAATVGTGSTTGVILDEDQRVNTNNPNNPDDVTDEVDGDKPVVSVSDATTDEGGDLVHTVTLSNPTEVPVSYPFAITDGSATAGDDYSNAPVFSDGVVLNADGSITIPAGVTNFTVSYPALNDDLDELNETTTLTIGTGVGTGTITDTDVAPIISISATDATGIEGVTDDTIVFSIDQAGLSDRATSVIATLNLTDAEAADIDSILLTNADGSTQTISVADAIAGVTVSIPAGTLLADMPSFSITPTQDAIYEISETIGMSLSSPVNAALGTATASAEILDEDGGAIDAPVVSIAATDAQAIEGVDNTLIFSVTQTNLSNLDTTVNVSLGAANTVEAADIASISYTNATGVVVSLTTATQIQDFLANGASVTIPAGETAAPVITVTIADDVVYEQSEDLVLEIGSPVNATIGTNSATGVILDESNDPANPGSNTEGDKPVVSVSDATTDEGGDLVHTVTLSNPTEVPVSYPFAITDGSATAGDDYSNAPVFSDGVVLNADGSITIPAGVTNFTVSYPALNDDLDELNETTTLTIGTGVGTGTITDTDVAPIISISATDATGIEGVTDDTIVFSIDQAGLSDRATSVIATLNLTDAEAADIDSILLTNADGSTQTISVADAIAGVTVSIPAGTLLADMPSFSITPTQDAIYEISETIGMSLSSPVNAALGTATASAEILDEDGGAIDAPVVSIAATDAQAIEGVDNTLIFSVTQTNLSNLDTTVNVSLGAANTVEAADIASISYTNATGVVVSLTTATQIQDFLANGASVTIPAGETAAPVITVTIADDVVYEQSEDLVLEIGSPVNATIGTNSATGVILDESNDPANPGSNTEGDKPVVSVSDATTDEGGDLVHTVTLSNPTEVPVSYPFAITDGSATTATGDYSNAPVFSDGVVLNADGSITIPAGVTNFTVSYPALNDDLDELNETTTLTIGTGVGTGTITDTDVAPIISISATDATGIEGVTDDTIVFSIDQAGLSDRATSVIATLNLTDAEAADIDSILLTNADGSTQTISVADAIAGVTVSIPAGTLLADMPSFSITPTQDAIYEISETIGMSLSSPVNAALGTATASAEILDEDGGAIDAPVVSIAATDAQAIEGVDNTLIFSVTQTNLSNLDTTVNVSLGAANTVEAADIASISYTNATGVVVSLTTATQIQDFLANGASVTIPAGETAAPVITVTIADDVVYEQSEDLVLEIGSPVNATIGTNSATGVILDESNDPANPGSNTEGDKPVVSVSDATTDEGGDLVHTVTLSNPTEVPVSYPFAITDGSATAGDDYSNAPVFSDGVVLNADGSITIPAGVTNFTVSYPALNDDLDELNETTTLTIGTGVGTGTITDTDVAPIISISATDATGIEGVTDDTIVFSIDQAGLSDRATSVIATLNLTDAEAADIDSILLTNADGSTQTISVADAIAGVTVSIPAGTLLADMPSFSITPTQDAIYEISETIGMSLSSPVNAALGTATASAEILDEDGGAIDAPVVSIAATDAQAIEGVDNTLIFSVTQTNLSNLDTTVNVSLGAANTVEAADIASISYTNATGVVVSLTTATQIQDFLANGASVTIPAGETAAPVITVTIADDVVYEQSEDLVLEIGSPVNATIGTNSATGVILDESNDPANPGSNTEGDKPVVSVSDATTDEGGDLVHTVTLSNPTEVPVSYPFAITDGSATTATGDYSNAPVFSDGVVLNADGSITIPAGVTNFTVSYPALNDDLDELNETTTLTIGTGVGTGTITDTDVAPIISISATDATGIEGVTDDTIVFSIDQAGLSDRATSVIATLNLTDAEAADIDSILLTNADGSTQTISVADAIAGVTVSIPAGTLLADMPSFSITPTQDAIYEISETIGMSLSSPVNAALGTATASAEILDEDGGAIDAPVVSIAATDAQAIEGVDNTLIFSVTQTNLSNLDTTVNVSLGAANTVEAADIASISYTNATGVVVSLTTATQIQDFLANGASVTIPAGETAAPVITVTIADDVVYEQSEDLVLEIGSPVNATIGTNSATGVILDESNDPANPGSNTEGDKPVVSVSDATTDEGGDLVHTVTLSNPTEVPVSYPFAITDGSATTATGDYSNAPVFSDGVVLNADGSITIPAGVTNFTVSYPALNDDLDELNETTTLTIGTGVGTGTITDTDVAPIISISATDATGIEGVTDDTIVFSIDQAGLSDRATSVIATLNLTDAEAADIDSILLTNADGSTQTISVADAIAGVTVSIPAGTLLADMPSFSITPTQDAIYEISETIGMSLSSPVNAALGTATASAEILDEDGGAIDAPVVSIAATDAQAIEGVDNTLIFSVTQTNLSNLDTTVNVSLGAANTVEAADIASISYTNATGVVVTLDNLTDIQAFLTNGATVTIPAGSTSAPAITVTVIDDVVYERSEDLVLNIAIPTSSPTAATVGTGSTTGVILDEDQRVNTNNPNNPDDVTDEVDGDKPVVSVSDATTDEGGDLVHTVTLSNPTEVPVSYPFAITDGSATTATGDYSNAPVFSDGVVLNADGSITIPAGVTNFTVSYPALNDDLDELNETTTLTIGTGVGTGTITDTDVAPIISISATDATGIEGVTDDTIVFSIDQAGLSDRATSVIATLNLTDAEAADIDSILLTNADGSTQTISVADAIAGVTVSIPAGTLLADMPSFSITPTQDAIYEISETIGMSLSSPVNAALGTATASAEILDEDGGAIDAPVVSIAATDAQAIEGVDNTLIFSVTQTNLSNLDTTVNVSLGAANTVEAADIASISYTNATGVVVTLDNLTDIQAFLTNGATVTIPAGSTSAPAITVTVIDDVVYERSEDLVLNIAIPTSSPTAATVGTGSTTGVILDEDQRVNTNNPNNPDDVTDEVDGDKPVVSVSDATTDEGGDLVHTVTLSNPTEVPVSYPFAITDGSATAGDDYSNAPVFSDGVVLNADGSITIPAGVTNFTVSYPALNDDLDELNETTTLTIGTGVGTGTITDTDVAPIISISATDATGIEGVTDDTIVFSIDQAGLSDRATSVIATLNLTDAEAADIDSILLTNADGSTQTISVADAIAGVTVSIPAGTLLADMPSFSITPTQDAIYEISETIGMSLSSPVNAALGTATASAEILDEDGGAIDAPVVSIAATDAQAIEGVDNTLIFSVTQTNLSNLDTTVNVSLGAANTVEAADIASISYTNATGVVVSLTTATQIQDFLANGASVTIPAGETAAPVITVTIADDVVYEQSEDLVLEIGSPVNATIGTNSATGVILDESNDPANPGSNTEGDKPVVSVSNATTDEGGDLVHTVTLSNPTEVPVSYPFAITDGSATAGDDYSNAPVFSDGVVLNTDGSITIPAGVTNFTVSYPALNDDLDELNETTTLTIGTGVGTGTITDTDVAPIISISATDATGIEGVTDDTIVFSIDQAGLSDRATSVIATLNLTDAEAADIDSILLTNADGSTQTISVADAIAGVTVSIPAGTLLADMPSFSITPTQDAIYEISETIGMSLSSPVNAALGTATASAEILDEDGGAIDAPVVSIAATDAQAIEGVDNTLIFSVTQTNLSNLDTTVNVSLGAANTVEAADIASISYTNATGVVVTLDNLTDIQAFLTNGATVTIPAGSTSAPAITVTVIDDVVYERSEDLVLNIAIPTSSPTAATVGTGSTTGVILDEDQRVNTNNPNNPDDVTDEVDGDKPVVGITATDAQAVEGVDNTLVFTVAQNNLSNFDTTVKVSLGSSTLVAADIASISYTDATGAVITLNNTADIQNFLTNGDSVKIPAGSTSAPAITVTVINDNIYEQSENIVLTISNASNATFGSNASATGTVFDEDNGNPNDGSTTDGDKPVVSITGTENLSETAANGSANTATYTVSLSNPSALDTSVVVSIAAGSATGNGTDYIAPVTQEVTIPAGQTSVNITVPLIDDTNFEGPENFTVSISSIAPVSTGNVTIDPVNNTVNTTIYDDGTTDGTTPGGVNDNIVPVAVADTLSLIENVSVGSNSGNVLTNDNLGNTPTQSFTWGTEFASYGSITKNPDGTYNYALSNGNTDVQALAIGETLTETFTYSFRDQDGETANSTLTITITGTNDQPKITNGASTNGVIDSRQITEQTDASVITQTGTINFTDVDTSNELTLSYLKNQNIFTFGSNTALTSLTADQQVALENIFSVNQPSTSNNEASWNINASSTALDFIPPGETVTIRYAVQVNDNEGITTVANGNQLSASDIRYIQVTITGTNDGIALVNDSETMLEDGTLTGNIFTNDNDDPDIGEMLTIESYEVNGTVVPVTAGTNTAMPVTIDGNIVGQITMNSDGSYVFTPTANYSGTIPTITTNVSNGLPVGNPNRSSGSETLDITVTPVSDAPTLSAVSVTTNEDTAVVLGLKAPIINDATDLTANTDDSPERIGLITLTGIPRGVTLDYGSGNITTATVNQTITILLSDGPTVVNPLGQDASTITMTRAEFEAIELTPPEDSAANITIDMAVTEYEVDSTGAIVSGVAGAASSTTIKVDVQAVTDSSSNNAAGDDVSTFGYTTVVGDTGVVSGSTYTVSAQEGESVALPITTAFGDLVGSGNNRETYGFVISGLQPDAVISFTPAGSNTVTEYTANSSGEVLIGVNATSPTSTTLAVSSGSEPKISIKSAIYNSLDMKNIEISLYTQDHDTDSTPRNKTVELISTVTVDMTVTPVAGVVAADNVSTTEDTTFSLAEFNFRVGDDQSGNAVPEIVTEIKFDLPAGWTYTDTDGIAVVVGNTITINMTGSPDLSGFLLTPTAQSSTDTDITFDLVSTDLDDDNDLNVDIATTTLTKTVTITPVAEVVGEDIDGDGTLDLTINPDHAYTNAAQEEIAFSLGVDGAFRLLTGWANQDDTVDFGQESHTNNPQDSEQTYAHLTFGYKNASGFEAVEGAVFTYSDGTSTITLTDSGTGVDIPAAYLNSVTVISPEDYSDFNLASGTETAVKVEAKTIDYDEDTGMDVEAISGESYLTFKVAGVADNVSLGVDPSYGNEDQALAGGNMRDGSSTAVVNPTNGIALQIRPSSRDDDGSEIYNVTITDIPVGAQLYVVNASGVSTLVPTNTVTDTATGKVTETAIINNYTNDVTSLYFVPAENYSGTVNLKVSAVSEESDGDISASSAILNLPVAVIGKADLILNDTLATETATVTATDGQETTKDYTYVGAEDAGNIALSEFFSDSANIAAYDSNVPTAEQVTYKVTGLPTGFDITGAVFLGGSGLTRSWSVSLDALKNGTAELVTPSNFAGEVDFTITGTTTETVSGNSATHNTQNVSVLITPDATDSVVANPQVLATEDVWTTVNFLSVYTSTDTTALVNIATGYEALETIILKADDLISREVALRVDNIEVTLVAGETYIYTPDQRIEIMYDDDKRHSDDDVSIPFDYTYTDTATLTDGSTITTTSPVITGKSVDVTFQAVTDQPTLTLTAITLPGDTAPNSTIDNSGSNDTASVTVSLTSPDQDGSESFTRLEISNVPAGIRVEGGILAGNTWYVDVPDTAITGAAPAPEYELVFIRDTNIVNIRPDIYDITVVGFNQDINGQGIDGNEARDSQIFKLTLARNGTGGIDPVDPDLINTLTVTSVPQPEDAAIVLSTLINATLNSEAESTVSAYSFTLTDLPDDTVLTSSNPDVQVQKIAGQWIISVEASANLTPNEALAAITLTPPTDFSTNEVGQELVFDVGFTALNDEGLDDNLKIDDVKVEIKPVTDAFDNDGQTSIVSTDEDAPIAININLTNTADGDYVSLVDGKLYIKIDETGLTTGLGTAGVLTYNGITLTPDNNGEYIVDLNNGAGDLVNPPDSVIVQYTPAENADGSATITVNADHKEVTNVSGTDDGNIITYQHSYDVSVAAQPDALSIAGVGNNDGDNDPLTVTATGNEDTLIAIPYEISLSDIQGDSDGSGGVVEDSAAAISLDNVPNGYLVYYANASGNLVLASNNGVSPTNADNNSWSIDASKLQAGTDNIFISAPENESGVVTGIEMSVISDSGLVSTPLSVTLDVTPVADAIEFSPSSVIGSQGKWTSLNLNAAMVDIDGSETVNVILTGTNLYGDVLDVKTKSGTAINNVTFDAATGTYTIIGVTPSQLNDLLVKSAAPYTGTLQISLQTVESANGNNLTIAAKDLPVNIAPTLIFNGTTEDDVLISVNQTAAVKYSGGDGNDTFIGGSGKDTLNGDAGDDVLTGNAGNDTINGGTGDDILSGGSGNDILSGGADDDTIDGGAGADTLNGGTGNDTIIFDAADLVINGGDGIDTLLINEENTTINFGTFDSSKFESIEVIDMTGNGAQSLTNLSTSDVLDIINDTVMTDKDLIINGDSDDSVSLTATGWANSGTTTQDGINYNVYSFSDTNGNHDLLIQTDVNTTIL